MSNYNEILENDLDQESKEISAMIDKLISDRNSYQQKLEVCSGSLEILFQRIDTLTKQRDELLNTLWGVKEKFIPPKDNFQKEVLDYIHLATEKAKTWKN